MKKTLNTMLAMLCVAVALTGIQAQAQETTPPLVRQLYNGNWPSESEAQELLDELYYQRAVHAYMTMLPALNVIGMRDGSSSRGGNGSICPATSEAGQ